MMQNKALIAILILWTCTTISFALPTDKNKPATITSNSAEYNQNSGETVFEGNVIVIQGSTKITANKIVTYTNKKQKLTKAIAFGSAQDPAVYQTVPKKGDAIFKAQATEIKYLPNINKVYLIGNGQLAQQNNTLKSNFIIYNQKTGELQTKKVGNQRTVIVLQPSAQTKQSQKK